MVVCIDDSHIARPWSGPSQSCRYAWGIPERQTHDYARHGVTALFAALNVATGEVTDACYPRHRHQQFLKFLKKTAAAYPRTELRRLARARPECGRPDRLGTNHAPERRPRHRRAQEAALPAPAHRRPHHPGTTTNLDPDRPDMALGQRSRRSFHRPRAPACPYLTVSRPIHPPGTARRSRTTRRALSHAQLTQRPGQDQTAGQNHDQLLTERPGIAFPASPSVCGGKAPASRSFVQPGADPALPAACPNPDPEQRQNGHNSHLTRPASSGMSDRAHPPTDATHAAP